MFDVIFNKIRDFQVKIEIFVRNFKIWREKSKSSKDEMTIFE